MKATKSRALYIASVVPASLVGALTLAPQNALADENMGAALLVPQLSEVIPMIIVFVIVWGVLGKLAWPKITGMLDKRAATIKESLETAEAAKIEAQELLEEYKSQIADARRESAEILAQARRSGEAVKADIAAQAQAEAEEIISKARIAIESEKKQALAELQGSIAELSVAVAGRLIKEDLSDEEHKRLIKSYVSEAGNFDAH